MNSRERESYYYILGVQPGASTAEIKSAFRRLVKLYHADQDQSLDAEMKYREIQTAYRELLKQPASKAGFGANYTQQTTQTGHQKQQDESGQRNTSSNETPWYVTKDIRDWETEHTAYRSAPRISFKLENLPLILKASFNELHYHIFKAALILALISCIAPPARSAFAPPFIIMPYVNLLLLFYPISFIFLLLFRYYFIPSAWPPIKQILAAGIYGAVLMFLITRFYTIEGFFTGSWRSLNASTLHLVWTGIFYSVAAWIIIANPIPSITSTPYD